MSTKNDLAQRNLVRTLQDYIEVMTPLPHWRYRCTSDFVMQHGALFESGAFPRSIRRRARQCYQNSLRHALANNLSYVEGFAVNSLGRDIRHAWCAEKFTGIAIDPTWSSLGLAYYGVAFDSEFVQRYFEILGPAILDNGSGDPVILRGSIPIEVWRDGCFDGWNWSSLLQCL